MLLPCLSPPNFFSKIGLDQDTVGFARNLMLFGVLVTKQISQVPFPGIQTLTDLKKQCMWSIQTFTERRMAMAAAPYFITVIKIKSFWCFFEPKEMI